MVKTKELSEDTRNLFGKNTNSSCLEESECGVASKEHHTNCEALGVATSCFGAVSLQRDQGRLVRVHERMNGAMYCEILGANSPSISKGQ
ncbi:hypothetical protein NFI96_013782 [Prochilodus magdalenae]|nr:hypothetical protein NFI96_013782 [Prochilodus magdalenae]